MYWRSNVNFKNIEEEASLTREQCHPFLAC